MKSVYQIWKKSLYLEKYSGLFRYLLPLHCTWRCAYQDRVAPACTGPPVFLRQKLILIASLGIDATASKEELYCWVIGANKILAY